jgi:tetratricopeptide (TPR) repeat protein
METMKAQLARNKGKPAESVAGFRRAVDYYDSIGHRRAACEALGNLGNALLELGQLEEGEVRMRQVLATANKMNLKYMVGGALQILTNILAYQGSVEEARASGQQAVTVTSAQDDRRFQGYAEAYLSVTEYLAGDYARAEDYARAAMMTWDTVLSVRPFAFALLARALLARGRQAEALLSAQNAYSQLENLGVVDDRQSRIPQVGSRFSRVFRSTAESSNLHASWLPPKTEPRTRNAARRRRSRECACRNYFGQLPPPLRTRDFTLMPDVFFFMVQLLAGKKSAGRTYRLMRKTHPASQICDESSCS